MTTTVENSPVNIEVVDPVKNLIQVSQGDLVSNDLVVKYEHHYPPHLYAVECETVYETIVDDDGNEKEITSVVPTGVYEKIDFGQIKYPAFTKVFNPDKHRGHKDWKFYVGDAEYEAYLKHLEVYRLEHHFFTLKLRAALRKSDQFISQPAQFLTVAYLYDIDEWETAQINRETPTYAAQGISFCSSTEQNYVKSVGRELALERAAEEYALSMG